MLSGSRAEQDANALLKSWRAGEHQALEQLIDLLYQDLKVIALREFRMERAGHTLQPTAVINEALLRMVESNVSFNDRCHFLALMTTAMRRVLVDHVRAKMRQRRGGDALRVTMSTDILGEHTPTDVLDLDRALTALHEIDERKSRILELFYFGGLSYQEIAEVTGLSEASVHRELRFSRAWLKNYLQDTG